MKPAPPVTRTVSIGIPSAAMEPACKIPQKAGREQGRGGNPVGQIFLSAMHAGRSVGRQECLPHR